MAQEAWKCLTIPIFAVINIGHGLIDPPRNNQFLSGSKDRPAHSPFTLERIRKMKNVPCFLALLSFVLALGTGCEASRSSGIMQASTSPVNKAKVLVGSEYEEMVVNSHLARYMRGEPLEPEPERKLRPGQVAFTCQATGEFNLGPSPDFILMEKYCVSPEALSEGVLDGFAVEDERAPRLKGDSYNFYQIPFDQSVVEVAVESGQTKVLLHFKDEDEKYHHIPLSPRQTEDYKYSFHTFVPKSVLPESQKWILNAEEIQRYRAEGEK